jgi:uncharacterized protein (TIGR03083 family)
MAEAGIPSLGVILEALGETLDSFGELLAELSPDDWHKPTGCPGWDVQDVVSHIVGGELGLGASRPQRGEAGAAEQGAQPDTNRTIAGDVESRRSRTPAELRKEFAEVTKASMARRRASDRRADEITDGPFGWKLPYDRLLSIRTFDVLAHEQDVRRAVGRPGNLDGEAAALVESLIFGMLNATMRQRVPALEDCRVRIELTDRDTHLVLGGTTGETAQAPAPSGTEPTDTGRDKTAGKGHVGQGARDATEATLRMPFGELIALACGRDDVATGLVSIDGDEGLAGQVLARMGFTP